MKTFYQSYQILNEGQTLEKLGFWKPLATGIKYIAERAVSQGWANKASHTLRGSIGRALDSTNAKNALNALKGGSDEAIKGAVKDFAGKAWNKMYSWADPLHNSNLADKAIWDTNVAGASKHRAMLSLFERNNAVAKLNEASTKGWSRPNMFKSIVGDTVKTIKDLGANGTYGKNLWNMGVNNWTNSQHYLDAEGFLRKRSIPGRIISGALSAPGVLGTAALSGGFDNPKESLKSLGFSAVTLGGAGIGQLGMAIG